LKRKNFNLLRRKIAREAALLLYSKQEKEYMQAKKRAAETLGVRILPTNREVAEELDKLAEEIEGEKRKERLIQMRREAFQIMQTLKEFEPRLVGSVWRGTISKDSDIDILIYCSNPQLILETLQKRGYNITQTEKQTITKEGERKTSFHIYLTLSKRSPVEIVVKDIEAKEKSEKCEIYLDKITGLTLEDLKKVLESTPLKKFIPK
jgi:predicted nucleotidyltransferase